MRDTDLAINFFTFLTLLANAATLGLAGTAGAARLSASADRHAYPLRLSRCSPLSAPSAPGRSGPGLLSARPLTGRPGPRRAWSRVRREVAGGATGLAWLVAAVAMSGSLWFSEVAGFTPCRLCWAQRACMYPLVPILALAAVTGRRGWRALGLALATVGAGIAVYHVLVERFPSLESGTCDPANPCSLVWFERFGFVTLPYMALSAFALIATLLLTAGVTAPTEHPAATTPTAPAMPTPDDRPGEPAPRLVARSFRRSAVSAAPASPAGDVDVTALEENLS